MVFDLIFVAWFKMEALGCGIADLIFVAWFKMEALGCGIATALTIAINASMVLLRLMRADGPWRLELSRLRIDPVICKSMVATGLPLGSQASLYSISNIIAPFYLF